MKRRLFERSAIGDLMPHLDAPYGVQWWFEELPAEYVDYQYDEGLD